jgi:hypothetical protein
MKQTTSLLVTIVFVIGILVQPVQADDTVARFRGAVGVIPTGSANTAVRGVLAAGQIWTIREFAAEIRSNGTVRAAGRGLLLAAGNTVGTNAGASVIATVFCSNEAGNIQHNTSPGVPLAADGDFVINAAVSPALPSTCTAPVLLIRNAGNAATGPGGWFAAGIPRLNGD